MNVAFFLTPKSEVVWVPEGATLRQAFERMRPHGYKAVPILDARGGYVGTITEGDILWHIIHTKEFSLRTAELTPLLAVKRSTNNLPIHINADIEALLTRVVDQNFVPVVDDCDVFIGIVPRKPIIEHCARQMSPLGAKRGKQECKPTSKFSASPASLKCH
jgi:CBS domain-containing protein